MTKKEKLELAKSKKPVVAEEPVEGDVEDTTKGEPLPQAEDRGAVDTESSAPKGENEVVYLLRSGQIRKFTRELHGDDYKKVAEAFRDNGKKLVVKEL